MKKLLPLLLLAVSCASHHQTVAPTFDQNKVCSPAALKYITDTRVSNSNVEKADPNLVREEILVLHPFVKECYMQEQARTVGLEKFFLCYVVGTDKKGKIEFSNFHTDANVSAEFKKCIDSIKKPNLSSFKSKTIIQHFNLYPKE